MENGVKATLKEFGLVMQNQSQFDFLGAANNLMKQNEENLLGESVLEESENPANSRSIPNKKSARFDKVHLKTKQLAIYNQLQKQLTLQLQQKNNRFHLKQFNKRTSKQNLKKQKDEEKLKRIKE